MDFRNLIAKHLSRDEHGQLGRYLLTGGVAWLVDVSVFSLCLLGVGVISAQFIARLAGAAVGFVGHKLVVFREFGHEPAVVVSQIARYASLWMLSFAVSTTALVALIDYAGFHAVTAKIVVESGIVVFNYLMMRSLIFRNDAFSGVNE